MDRGKNFKSSIPHSTVDFTIAVLGNTTSAPTVPKDGTFASTTSVYPIRANGVDKSTAGAPTRTSTGLYVITYSHKLPQMLFAHAVVVSAGGAPTAALRADVTIIDPPNRKITVLVTVPTTGTATDLGTSDMLMVFAQAQDSSA